MSKVFTRIGAVLLALAVFLGAYVRTSFIVSASGLATTKPTFGGSSSSTTAQLLDTLVDTIEWTLQQLDEAGFLEFVEQGGKLADDKLILERAKARAIVAASWKEVYKIFESSDSFITFIGDVILYDSYAVSMSYLNSPYESFIDKYGSEFEPIFQECAKLIDFTFTGRELGSDVFCVFDSPEDLVGFLESSASDGYYVENGEIIYPASDFKEALEQGNTLYTPKNATGKVSYRNDTRWHDYQDSRNVSYQFLSFFENGKFLATGTDEMYTVFFYKTDTDEYYGQYQFHFFFTEAEHEYTDRDEVYYTKVLNIEYWDNVDSSEEEKTLLGSYDLEGYNYVSFCVDSYSYRLSATIYETFLKYLNFQHITTWSIGSSLFDLLSLYSSDLGTSLNYFSLYNHFSKAISAHDSSCVYNGLCDIGYYGSVAPISTKYAIDTSKIPDNYYITTSGDTIYNYTITNPETGESDSITNYVTNNYTYITNNNGGSGTGSGTGGSLSGDITVGGNVNVGGQVDVNVNVNVNDNGGSSGAGQGTSFDDINTDPMDEYLNEALEESSGFRRFFEEFFGFLPPEILVLLGIGLTFCIIGRIAGR